MDTKLRVGLLLDLELVPAWVVAALERMARSNHTELALVVLNLSHSTRSSIGQASGRNFVPWMYRLFNAIDEKLFLHCPNALAQVDSSKIFSPAPTITVAPIVENGKEYFSEADVKKIKSSHLDILVKMGFGKLHGEILSAATHGMWTYRWGDPRMIEDGLIGFAGGGGWPETGASLQQLGANAQSNMTLFESWFFTYPYSPARN